MNQLFRFLKQKLVLKRVRVKFLKSLIQYLLKIYRTMTLESPNGHLRTLDGARERYENPTGLEERLTSDETDIRFW